MDGRSAEDACFRVLPDTCAELFFSCDAETIASVDHTGSAGTYSSFANFRMRTYLDVSMIPATRVISICFYPGAAYGFFPIAMQEVSDSSVSISGIWGQAAADLQEQVANTPGETAKVHLVQVFLARQLRHKTYKDGQLKYTLSLVDRMKGQVSVRDMAAYTGLSERQLNRHFIRQVGISPKEYAAMNRFIHSLRNLAAYPSDNLTEIAYRSGYYDQAHFIHEYRAFAGLTPGELLSGARVVIC